MKVFSRLSLIYLLLYCVCWVPFGISSDDVTLSDPIPVSFTTNGYTLSTGYSGELGEPIEASMFLYAVKDGKAFKKINKMEDLAKLGITINTKDEALDFLRLFWDKKTNYLFEKKTDRLLILNMIGDEEEIEFASIKESDFKKLDLRETKVVASGKNFIIEMNLVRPLLSDDKVQIIRCVNSLTSKGSYEMLSRKVVAVVPPMVVPIPFFE